MTIVATIAAFIAVMATGIAVILYRGEQARSRVYEGRISELEQDLKKTWSLLDALPSAPRCDCSTGPETQAKEGGTP